MSDSDINDIAPKGGFKPPPAFIQASLARQSKIKELQQKRADSSNENLSSSTKNLSSSKTKSNSDLKGKTTKKTNAQASSTVESNSTPHASGHVVPTSKTLMEIERLKQAREERRQKQAEDRKILDELNETDRANFIYHQLIDQFRSNFYNKLEDESESSYKDMEDDSCIKICVRKRPLNEKEKSLNTFDIITTKTGKYPNSQLFLHEPKTSVSMSKTIENHEFYFDHVYDEYSTNKMIYTDIAEPLVENFFDGGKVTFFAYGQTGSGKTHTIFGPSGGKLLSELKDSTDDNYDRGIYEYVCKDVFRRIEDKLDDNTNTQYLLSLCFFEIYGGKVYDLFNHRNKVSMLEDKNGDMQILGLKEIPVETYDDLQELLILGSQVRTTGSTEANPDSSRSHAIFQMTLYTYPKQSNSNSKYSNPAYLLQQQQHVGIGNSTNDTYGLNVHGRFLLIDLAGSERGEDTGNISRQARIEGAEINKSLLALKECIRALHMARKTGNMNSNHVPFRGSKLTQILRDSLVGRNSRSVMVATISPSSKSCDHSLNTLRYANRIKSYKSVKTVSDKNINVSNSKQLKSLIDKKSKENLSSSSNSKLGSTRQLLSTPSRSATSSTKNLTSSNSKFTSIDNLSKSKNSQISTAASNDNLKSKLNKASVTSTSSNKLSSTSSTTSRSPVKEKSSISPTKEKSNVSSPTKERASGSSSSSPVKENSRINSPVRDSPKTSSPLKESQRAPSPSRGESYRGKNAFNEKENSYDHSRMESEGKLSMSRSNSDLINSSMDSDYNRNSRKDSKIHNNIYSDCNELYSLHKDISNKLQEEDSLIKNHSYTLKKCLEYEEEENYLLKKVAKNDFDIDFYVNRMEFILENKLNLLQNLYSSLKSYKANHDK